MDNALAAIRPAACRMRGRFRTDIGDSPNRRKHCLFDDNLVHRHLLESPSFISMRLKVYLMGVVRGVSLVSRTKTASSFAGSVLLALRLIEWIAPGGSDQFSPGR